jgi:hypothetical protein
MQFRNFQVFRRGNHRLHFQFPKANEITCMLAAAFAGNFRASFTNNL